MKKFDIYDKKRVSDTIKDIKRGIRADSKPSCFEIVKIGSGRSEQFVLHDMERDTYYYVPSHIKQTKHRIKYLQKLKERYENEAM